LQLYEIDTNHQMEDYVTTHLSVFGYGQVEAAVDAGNGMVDDCPHKKRFDRFRFHYRYCKSRER